MKQKKLKASNQRDLQIALRLSHPHVYACSCRYSFHPSRCRPHPFSIGVVAAQHDGKRSQDDFEIEEERPVLYVIKIEAHHLFERQAVAA